MTILTLGQKVELPVGIDEKKTGYITAVFFVPAGFIIEVENEEVYEERFRKMAEMIEKMKEKEDQ